MHKGDGGISTATAHSHLAPEAWEWLFTLAVIAFLVWQAAPFREPGFDRGAGDRYREAVELKATILPHASGTGRVTEICTRFGGWLPQSGPEAPAEAAPCHPDSRHPIAVTDRGELDPAVVDGLARAHEALAQSLARPVMTRLTRLDELENRVREARAETDVQGAILDLAGETRFYRDAYGMAGAGARPLSLECAWSHLESGYRAPAREGAEAGRVLALVGMAALVDGDSSRAAAAVAPTKGAKDGAWSRAERDAGCAALGTPRQAVALAAGIVAKARASEVNAAKSTAARELLANAHWYFALWAAAGLLLLQVGRRPVPARRFLPLAAALWAGLGWLTHVHIEWISDRGAQTAWLAGHGLVWPDGFRLLLAGAFVLLIVGLALPVRGSEPARQAPSSRLGYAGFVLFVGLGWWLSLDLSATGHYANRFHALYQQVYVFAAFILLTMLAPLRLKLADGAGRWLGLMVLFARRRGAGLRRLVPWAAYAAASAAVLAAAGALHTQQTQLTSEIFRLWLVLGMSWFFFVRGESVLALAAGGTGSTGGGLHRLVFVWPLILVLLVPLAGLVLTDDFGPLFVMLYAASIFLGAAIAFAYFDRAGYRQWLGGAVGILVAGAWVYLLTFALYSLPAPLARIAERLESVRNPFTATNDQMAVITWFQESAPTT